MIPIAPGSTARASRRRHSLLLASSAARGALALAGVALIWLTTGWAMGWW